MLASATASLFAGLAFKSSLLGFWPDITSSDAVAARFKLLLDDFATLLVSDLVIVCVGGLYSSCGALPPTFGLEVAGLGLLR